MTLQHPHFTCIFPDDSVESGVAHFSGHSWISLPTLTHAYSDLQLSFEFKPEAEDGILLLTGETRDMTGDYLALLLRQGHVELRYNQKTHIIHYYTFVIIYNFCEALLYSVSVYYAK